MAFQHLIPGGPSVQDDLAQVVPGGPSINEVVSTQTLTPGLYTDADTFYSPTVSASYSVTPGLYTDPDTFYSATISSTYVIAPTLYVDADTFYAATVGTSGGPQTLLPSLYVDPDTFYVHIVTGGLGSGVGQRTRYITVEFYDSGDVWRTNVARDILEYSTQPSKIAFSYISPQDSIAYATSTDKIHYTRGQVMGSIQRRSAFKKVFVAPPPPPPPPTDTYFSNVVTLLHMDGADGSTVFTDVKGHTFTAAGNAQIDTAQSRFGGASGLFDGAGDYLSAAAHADFGFAAGDWTVEAWVRPTDAAGDECLFDNRTGGATGCGIYTSISTSANRFGFANNSAVIASGGNLTVGVWAFIAVARASGTVRGFINGVLAWSVTDSRTYSGTPAIRIGASSANQYFAGHVDEIRITKGVARYTADFTPPDEPFLDQ